MKTAWRLRCFGTAGLGLALGALTGCQTWVGGMTLPSGHYLEHQPQFFAPSPPFPLTHELATQEGVAAAGPIGPAGAPVPAPAAVAPPAAPLPGPAVP